MSEIIKEDIDFGIGRINVFDVAENPDKYPEEIKNAVYDVLSKMSNQISAHKRNLKENIIITMKRDGATKSFFKDIKGEKRTVTLKKGTTKCVVKNADEVYENAGFDSSEIGEKIYRPLWSKAKEARKVGGKKQEVIDKIFIEGNPDLEIK
ncbi:MAG: hypothetical protein PVF17_00880 [Ignavibacteria bacterium]|jgi:hypothetical protein